MAKILVQAGNIDEFICRETGKFYLNGSVILTPGARDALCKRKIAVVNGSPPACGAGVCGADDPDFERLFYGVAAMLQSEYGIKDPETLKAISLRAVEIIKDNV